MMGGGAVGTIIISLQNKGTNLPILYLSFFSSAHPSERACHPERSAPQARGAKDLFLNSAQARAAKGPAFDVREGACPERSEGICF
jgi:hypothetical protein